MNKTGEQYPQPPTAAEALLSTQLRQAAEAQLVRAPEMERGSPHPAKELLHELSVHQIELEMQNEQLRQAQLALEESRDLYVDLYEFAPVGYLTLTRLGIISEINLTGATLIGVERGKLLHRNFKYFIALADSERWDRYFVNVVQRGIAGSCELALKRGDGHFFHAQLDCLRMEADSEAAVRIALTDITGRKQAEEELRIAAIAFETQEGIMVTDTNGVIVHVNHAFTHLTGYSAEELVGKTPALLNSKRHDQPFYRRLWATLAMERYWQGEVWNRRKDGNIYAEWLTIHAVTTPDGKRVTHYVATYSDVTQNEALNRLHKIASHVPGVVFQFRLRPDGSSYFPYASDAIREIFRVSPEEVRKDASNVFSILYPDDYEGVVASIQVSARDLIPWRDEFRVKFDDGTVRWLFSNALPQHEEDGSVLWHGLITDITERKQTEMALMQYKRVVDSAIDGFWMTDAMGNLQEANAAYAKMSGYSIDELVNMHVSQLEAKELSLEEINAHIAKIIAQGYDRFETRHRHKDGHEIDIEVAATFMPEPRQFFVFCHDITERKKAE